MCGPELMRVLMDEEELEWDEAWDIVTNTISYTNHTILPEALEKWPISTFSKLLPRVYQIIDEISRRYSAAFDRTPDGWQDRLRAHRHPVGRRGAHGEPLGHLQPLGQRRGPDPHRHPRKPRP